MEIAHTPHLCSRPWPEGTFVQGGDFSYNHEKKVAFVEAFPEGLYLRGEGATIREAEDKTWTKYQKWLDCPGHEWETRDYKNGYGFCKHCGTGKSDVFTYEEAGAFCVQCGKADYWHVTREGDILCKECAPPLSDIYPWLKEISEEDEEFLDNLADKVYNDAKERNDGGRENS